MAVKGIYQDLLSRNGNLTLVGLAYFALFLILLITSIFDTRQLLGINIWIKPMKFALSLGIFTLTFAYLLDLIPISKRRKTVFANIIIYTMLIEIVIIVGQAAVGEQSHFNKSSILGGVLYGIMGLSIAIAFIMICLTTIDYFRMKTQLSASLLWAIRIGLLIMILGNIGGIMMSAMFTHSVGIADGGDGLPFVNWSTIAGDLRVMHFFGMHGIQLLPFVALGSVGIIKSEQNRMGLIVILGLLYGGFVSYVFWQALNGMPFL